MSRIEGLDKPYRQVQTLPSGNCVDRGWVATKLQHLHRLL